MEFWGVEVPSGRPVTCDPGDYSYIHISQAALGEVEKGSERIVLKIKTEDKEIVVGTLSVGKCDQIVLDLIFDKEFTISHSGSSSVSVYFAGYRTETSKDDQFSSEDDLSDEEEEEEEADIPTPVQIPAKENGKLKKSELASKESAKAAATPTPEKPEESKSKVATKIKGKTPDAKQKVDEKPNAKAKADDDSSDEDEDEDIEDEDDDDEDDDEDEDMLSSGSDDDDFGSDESDEDDKEEDESDEGSDEESDEEKQHATAGKKRPLPALQKAPVGKKNKVGTPQGETKPGKKEVKTPSSAPPSKQQQQQSAKKDKKTPGKENNAQPATPGSGKKLGQYTCAPCNKNFTTESALSQHKAAKHK